MARQCATWIGAIRGNRFAQIDSQKATYFHNVWEIRTNRLKPAIRDLVPWNAVRIKKSSDCSDREPWAYSRESGHLSLDMLDIRNPSKPDMLRFVSLWLTASPWKAKFRNRDMIGTAEVGEKSRKRPLPVRGNFCYSWMNQRLSMQWLMVAIILRSWE